MSQPYIGEIRMFAGSFAPAGWAFCDGSVLPIAEYDALFSLIGTIYGGDGQSTFRVPDLRGRVPVHQGQGPATSNLVIGEAAGTEQASLTVAQIPAHNHSLVAATGGSRETTPSNNLLAAGGPELFAGYRVTPNGTLGSPLAAAGGIQPHENMAPFLAISFIISLFGIYPSQA